MFLREEKKALFWFEDISPRLALCDMAVLTASVDPASVPARPPPLGEVADFKTTSPFFYLTVAISAFFIPLMYAFLAIRLYIRTRCADKWKTDDSG